MLLLVVQNMKYDFLANRQFRHDDATDLLGYETEASECIQISQRDVHVSVGYFGVDHKFVTMHISCLLEKVIQAFA